MTSLAWLTETPIAHRGFHDMNGAIWENTLAAFSRAVEAGFAIECDVQLAADSVPVVFHDRDLQRLCNVKGDVRERTSAELGLLSVGGTSDKIPTLRRMLDLVSGRVPIVIEMKGRSPEEDEGFAEDVLDVLDNYRGHLALMSFDHHILRELKRAECPYPLGLTAEGTEPDVFFLHDEAMQLGLDFISYHWRDLPNSFITAQRQRGMPIITWTVRDEIGQAATYNHADQMTFEGFDPREAGPAKS